MIGTIPEDSDKSYNDGIIIGNGAGQGDILIRIRWEFFITRLTKKKPVEEEKIQTSLIMKNLIKD